MFDLGVLDVAIGVTFVYILLSLVCTAISEWVARAMALRADTLKNWVSNFLLELLQDSTETAKWSEAIFGSYMVKSFAPPAKFFKNRSVVEIPPVQFAEAFLQVAGEFAGPGKPGSVQEAKDLINRIEQPKMKQFLSDMMEDVQQDVRKLKENLAIWYDQRMDRLSVWYKGRAQLIALFVAAGVTLVLNVDTIALVDYLSKSSPKERAAIVAMAQQLSQQKEQNLQQAQLKIIDEKLSKSGIPFGWWTDNGSWRPLPDAVGWLQRVLGWLITTFAIALGAPFWFDVLYGVLALRSKSAKLTQQTEDGGEPPSPA